MTTMGGHFSYRSPGAFPTLQDKKNQMKNCSFVFEETVKKYVGAVFLSDTFLFSLLQFFPIPCCDKPSPYRKPGLVLRKAFDMSRADQPQTRSHKKKGKHNRYLLLLNGRRPPSNKNEGTNRKIRRNKYFDIR